MEFPKELDNRIEDAGQFSTPDGDRMNELNPYGVEAIDEAHRLADINQHIADIHGGNGMQQNVDGPILPNVRLYEPQTLEKNQDNTSTLTQTQNSTGGHALEEAILGSLKNVLYGLIHFPEFMGSSNSVTHHMSVPEIREQIQPEPAPLNVLSFPEKESTSTDKTPSNVVPFPKQDIHASSPTEDVSPIPEQAPNNVVPFKVREEEVANAA